MRILEKKKKTGLPAIVSNGTRDTCSASDVASRIIFHDVYPGSKEDPNIDELLAAVVHSLEARWTSSALSLAAQMLVYSHQGSWVQKNCCHSGKVRKRQELEKQLYYVYEYQITHQEVS